MNETLQLRDISGYLPYGLQAHIHAHCTDFICNALEYSPFTNTIIWESNGGERFHNYDYGAKPLLLPLSCLIEEIEHNGKKIVPIVELAKLAGANVTVFHAGYMREQNSYYVTKPVFDPSKLQSSAAKKNIHPEALCPYGQPGDVLYVRETHWMHGWWNKIGTTKTGKDKLKFCSFSYNRPVFTEPSSPGYYKRPGIFLFKKDARIFLRVVDVRCERLRDITQDGAISEGVLPLSKNYDWMQKHFKSYWEQYMLYHATGEKPPLGPSPRDKFERLWSSINGEESWQANPHVWVVTFARITNESELNHIKNTL